MENEEMSPLLFAVMGATGTGKSTFVRLLTNAEHIHIGYDQDSETFDIQTADYIDEMTGRQVILIDTPGFDDSREGITDSDILQKIIDYLEPEGRERRKLNGIIYMHRISDPRVGGVSRKNFRMFYSLCGEENLGNVRVVTTNWSRVTEEEGSRREVDLKNGAFKALVDAGAQMRRHANTLESALQIISELLSLQQVTMKIQEELQAGKKLVDTDAGKVLAAQMQQMQRKHAREMADLKGKLDMAEQERNQALRAELELACTALVEKIARVEADLARLEKTVEEHREEEQKKSAEKKESQETFLEMEKVTDSLAQALKGLCPKANDIRGRLCLAALASTPRTTRIEDTVHSLLRAFSMTLIVTYGEGDRALGRFLSQLLMNTGDTGILAWTGTSGSFNSCLPIDIGVFNPLLTSPIPPAVNDDKMGRLTARLRAYSKFDLTLAIKLRGILHGLSIPYFRGQVMKLPCLAFRVTGIATFKDNSERVFRLEAVVLHGTVDIKTNQNLEKLDSLYLVYPWMNFLLDQRATENITETIPNDSRNLTSSFSSSTVVDEEVHVYQFLARLRQRFGALLLASTRRGTKEYRRIHTENLIKVRVGEITSARLESLIQSVQRLDVV